MSVEIVPKNNQCYGMGISNGSWYELLENKEIANLIGGLKTNDPIDVSKETALKILEIVKKTTFSEKWSNPMGDGRTLMELFIEFLECCDGFKTY